MMNKSDNIVTASKRNENQEKKMAEHIYKKIELVGSSETSIEEAVNNALEKASETLRSMRWCEVIETRGYIQDSKVAYWQVTIKVGFTVE